MCAILMPRNNYWKTSAICKKYFKCVEVTALFLQTFVLHGVRLVFNGANRRGTEVPGFDIL